MERTRGEKGKPGETDRQIIFTIVINEEKHPEGLTKREISTIIENATDKEREGIRRHMDRIVSGEGSPLKGIVKVNNDAGKKRYRIERGNLRDVARLYNFLIPDRRLFGALKDRMSLDMGKFLSDVIDYLFLWDPNDPIYGLPEKLRESWEERSFDFYPRLYPSNGPVRLKEKAQKYGVIDSIYHSILGGGEEYSYLAGISRFFDLIVGFESFISQEYKDREMIEGREIIERKRYSNAESGIAGSIGWFMNIWREAWDDAVNEGFFVEKNTPERELETNEDVARFYDVPPEHVSYSHETIELMPKTPELDINQEFCCYIMLPEAERPVIHDYFYQWVKFVGDKYEFQSLGSFILEGEDKANTEEGTTDTEEGAGVLNDSIRDALGLNKPDTDWIKKWILIK